MCDSKASHIDSTTLVRFFTVDAERLEESFAQFVESWTNFGCSIGQVGNPGGKLSNSKKLAQLIAEVTAILADHIVFATRPALGHFGNEHMHFRRGEVRVTHVNRLSVRVLFARSRLVFKYSMTPRGLPVAPFPSMNFHGSVEDTSAERAQDPIDNLHRCSARNVINMHGDW